jgi:hypothetical protein
MLPIIKGNQMKIRITSFALKALAAAAFVLPQIASASLVFDSTIHATAQGFGNAPRDLTLQATGQVSNESGCVGVAAGGAISFGSCISDPSPFLFQANGVANMNGTAAMPSPLADDNKYGIPTIGSLGITSASQIGVLFNPDEPQNANGESVNVLDVTLKFYTSNGTLLGAIDGQQNFATSDPGVGIAGFTFVVDAVQQTYVNGLLAAGGAGTKLALEATIGDFGGGPDTFLIYNTNNPGGSVPEPATVTLLGLGLLGFAASRRKSAKK